MATIIDFPVNRSQANLHQAPYEMERANEQHMRVLESVLALLQQVQRTQCAISTYTTQIMLIQNQQSLADKE